MNLPVHYYFSRGDLWHKSAGSKPVHKSVKEMTLQAEQFEREVRKYKGQWWEPYAERYARQCRTALAEYEAHHTPERQSA